MKGGAAAFEIMKEAEERKERREQRCVELIVDARDGEVGVGCRRKQEPKRKQRSKKRHNKNYGARLPAVIFEPNGNGYLRVILTFSSSVCFALFPSACPDVASYLAHKTMSYCHQTSV